MPPNRLEEFPIEITYPGAGNNTQLTYDGIGQVASVVETVGGTATVTKQWVWCGGERCEERDGTNVLTKQYFEGGQQNFAGGSGTSYCYFADLLGSVCTMTDDSGTVVSDRKYDAYGRVAILTESITPDFGYAGLYQHPSSGLNFAFYRVYKPDIGRWLNRDPLAEVGGSNLYEYSFNQPTSVIDPSGLKAYSLADFASAVGGKPSEFTNGCIDVVNKYLGLPPGSGDPAANNKGKCWLGEDAHAKAEAYKNSCKCGGVVWSKQGTLQGDYAQGPVPSEAIGGPPGWGGGFNYVAQTPSGMYAYMNWMAPMLISGGVAKPSPGIKHAPQIGYIDPTPPNFPKYPHHIWCARCKKE